MLSFEMSNHKGDIAIAKELIHMQRFFCVDAVKFQKE
jgi:sialic acid synthase SpsE